MKLYLRLFIFCCFWFVVPAYATVRLPQLISDGMVLQRNVPLNIWGWADAGEKVTVAFKGKQYKTKAAATGEWQVTLPAMKAGGPYTLDITASNTVSIKDILIGDVWFCSGQSNMVLPMERVKEKYPEDIAQTNNPQIRNFFVATQADVTAEHADVLSAKWNMATPKNVLAFGAATWFFANQLYKKYHVPIGIINSSVGGVPIHAWISREGLKNIAPFNARILQINTAAFKDSIAKLPVKINPPTEQNDLGFLETVHWNDTAYVPNNWHNFWLPGYWADQGVKSLNGIVWFRKEITLPDSMAGKPAKLFLGRIVDADEAYVNGKFVGRITYQYPPRRYEIPAGLLKAGKNIIVVRLTNTSGKGGFVPGKTYNLKVGNEVIDLRGQWQYKVGSVFYLGQFTPLPAFIAQNEPAGLFNTMVAPFTRYPVKGFLWNQGETNIGASEGYGTLLKTLIGDWRNKWHNAGLPFIYAQLANYGEVEYSPSESQWADVRQEQLSALSVSDTRMITTIDLGEWNDIHPLNKKDVGERFAIAAENLAYGELSIVPSGPIYQSAKTIGNNIEITFTNIGGGLVAKGEPTLSYFAVAGIDKKFVWATAVIQNNKVVVHSDVIANPMYVRYAWADNPETANLYNKQGLPASPFEAEIKQK
ncbi:sialate O-acetylesterase [Mucilaginibacter sp. ZT4R22]|uniref:Sialate O-acetylesterase n=1 Tax=Mucilaginibacter pankratovii TaxID=2772110 RepID=A0ABR7WLV1_9SPHI|nr:sialate O-acetylesterase [Mucilaginibacter pankratovii]MBD1362452.1 sialate O-acetylesterase [Mucilaginibacter pankratovii]